MLSFILLIVFGIPAVLAWKNYMQRERPERICFSLCFFPRWLFSGLRSIDEAFRRHHDAHSHHFWARIRWLSRGLCLPQG